MPTFSQVVDQVVQERKRPDLIWDAAAWLRADIRRLHSAPNSGSNTVFEANRHEALVTVGGSEPYLWKIPSATRFQLLEAAWNDRAGLYHVERAPSVNREENREPFYRYSWYRTGPSIAFSGTLEHDVLRLSYFMFPKDLRYKLPADRITQYDYDTDTYVRISDGAPASESELETETHWMLQRWSAVLEQGLRSAVYRNLGDFDRSRLAYSAFESDRLAMWQQEPTASFG